MKKLISIILVCLIVLCLPLGAFADDEYATAGEMYNAWYMGDRMALSPYPENVCGVWSSDGGTDNLTVAVTDDEAGERAKEKILASVADDSTLTFTTQKYSHMELMKVHSDITYYLENYSGEEIGVAGWGIYEMDNKVHVDIIMSKPGAEDFMRWGYKNFGDKIMFESVDGYPVPTAEELGVGDSEAKGMGGVIAAAAAVIVIICAVLIAKKRMFGKAKEESAE